MINSNSGVLADDVHFSLSYSDADSRSYATSQEDLAQALGGISRRTVARLLKLPGNPGRTANGSYPLEAWREFYEETKDAEIPEETRSELAQARLERERIRIEKEKLELDKMRGNLIPAETVKAEWQAFFIRIRQQIYKTFVEETDSAKEFTEAEKKFHKLLERIHQNEKARTPSASGSRN